jgi:collagenase-like PrtC family protease
MEQNFTSYKLGCNFDPELITKVAALNAKYKDQGVQVDEFYGSDRAHAFLAARPDFRLPEISPEFFEKYVQDSLAAGIRFNYTMNSINPGSKAEIAEKLPEIKEFIVFLEKIGVYRITVANLLMAEIIREVSSSIRIELSTIAHTDTVTQLKYLKDTFDIDKVCGNLAKNRNKRFLQQAADTCADIGMSYEIMLNEFCGVGSEGAITHCTFRDSCYIAHASDKTQADAELFDTYPMKYCMFARKQDYSSWLKLRWVRPEDIYRYEALGIKNFKITGRTGTTEYITTMAEAYLSRSWEGNLLQLWKPLETIFNHKNELDHEHDINIPNKSLNKFVGKWFSGEEGFRCEEELCGTTCRYCHDFFLNKFSDIVLDDKNAHKLGLVKTKKIIPISKDPNE